MQREVAGFLQTVRRTLKRCDMVHPGDHVLVALSGGVDSVATLAALARLRHPLNLRLSAAHVHHGLRGAEADSDAAFAAEIAARLGVAFELIRLPSSLLRAGNTEERAREERYQALTVAASHVRAAKIATGHTRDDQAETVVLRIVRGCGPRGLAGIRPVVRLYGGEVIRPLLDCARREVEAFLAVLGLPHCEDSSNRSPRFLRNRIRHEVLPLLRQLNPQVDRALADLAGLSGVVREDCLTDDTQLLSLAEMEAAAPRRREEIVRWWLVAARGSHRGIARRHVAAVLDLLGDGRPNRRAEVPGGAVLREYGHLRYEAARVHELVSEPQVLQPGESARLSGWRIDAGPVEPRESGRQCLPSDLWTAVLDAEAAPPTFLIRNARAGDRVAPCGMDGRRKLSDVFIDRKVPRALRARCPVVEAGDEVLWVPGVVRSGFALVGERTRSVVWLRAQGPFQPLLA